jgi:hypothetical protein
VLTLTIPVSEASKPRKVQVGSAKEAQQVVQTDSPARQSVNA